MVSIDDIKTARQNIIDVYGLSIPDASRVIGYYNQQNKGDIITLMACGDLSSVPAALAALGLSDGSKAGSSTGAAPEKIDTGSHETVKRSAASQKIGTESAPVSAPVATPAAGDGVNTDIIDTPSNTDILPSKTVQNASVKRPKNKRDKISADDLQGNTSQNKKRLASSANDRPDEIQDIQADIISSDDLPANTADMIREWFESWAAFENIDLSHLHSQQWRAACMMIGQKIKGIRLLYDENKIKSRGGVIYSGPKLEKLLSIWAYFCGKYKQVPLVSDFVSFSGVSTSFFYDYQGRGLTSTSASILKKARQVEEGGLGSSVAGGGAGAVGGMFLLKARHGYTETPQKTEVVVSVAPSGAALPVFDDLGGVLVDKKSLNV